MDVGVAAPVRKASRRAVGSWLLFDWAAQPYFTLITTFVFGPYFAARLAANPVEGQALWGYAAAAAGLVIAIFSPALGAIADTMGARKPWIAGFSVMLAAGSVSLWFAAPGVENAVTIALIAFAMGTIGAELATVFTNAMMPDLADEHRLGRLSGTGWAVGNIGGMICLILILGFFVGDHATGRTILGLTPVFDLDPARYEGDRATGPFTAVWYLVFVTPLFVFTPDAAKRMSAAAALRPGLGELGATLRGLRNNTNAARYLLANMIYTDGIVALSVFGAIYAASVFGWTAIELGLFGIVIIFAGIFGSLIGGLLDDRIGPKRVVIGGLAILALACVLILSIDRDRLFLVVPFDPPVAGDGFFASTGERVYLALGALIGAAAGPLQAASRTLLARIAPREKMTQFFGLYALTGKVTSFVGPLVIGAVTTISGSQRIGVSMVVLFFVAGAVLLAGVRPTRG